jgi:hypothetical protein
MNKVMKNTMLSVALIALLGSFSNTSTINPKTELKALFNKYRSSENMTLDFNLRLFGVSQVAAESPQFRGMVKSCNELYQSNIMGRTILNNKEMSLIVDDNTRTIICAKPFLGKNTDALNNTMSDADLNAFKIQLYKETPTQIQIELRSPDTGDKTYYFINRKTGLMDFYQVIYANGASNKLTQMDIEYTVSDLNSHNKPSDFSSDAFVKHKGESFIGQGKFSRYQIVNQYF